MRIKKELEKKFMLLGVAIFLIAIFLGYRFFTSIDLAHILSGESMYAVEVNLKEIALQKEKADALSEVISLGNEFFEQNFPLHFETEIMPWMGNKFGISGFENGEKVIVFSIQNQRNLQASLEKLLVSGESFQKESFEEGEIWTAEFSSDIALGFIRNYILFSHSKEAIQKTLSKKTKLAQTPKYRELKKDKPRQALFSVFIDTEKWQETLHPETFRSIRPLFSVLATSLPAVGIYGYFEDEGLNVSSKIITTEGVFKSRHIPNIKGKDVPTLAQFVPQDVLFFMSGFNLYEKYEHTNEFLSDMNDQLPLILEGILRSTSRDVVGDNFDFENDFLSHLTGHYAFVLDQDKDTFPLINITLIANFEEADIEANLSRIHEIIRSAQGYFTPTIKEVTLPDGTVREELIAAEEREIPIKKIQFQDYTYFTAQTDKSSDKAFSYGFIEGYFVFSSHEKGVETVISSLTKKHKNLSQNQDFLQSAKLYFSPSESYGFINLSKLLAIETWFSSFSAIDREDESFFSTTNFQNFLQTTFRNITFVRKVFPKEIFIQSILFFR